MKNQNRKFNLTSVVGNTLRKQQSFFPKVEVHLNTPVSFGTGSTFAVMNGNEILFGYAAVVVNDSHLFVQLFAKLNVKEDYLSLVENTDLWNVKGNLEVVGIMPEDAAFLMESYSQLYEETEKVNSQVYGFRQNPDYGAY